MIANRDPTVPYNEPMLTLVAMLALVNVAQDPLAAIKVSPNYRATRVPVLLKDLSEKVGVRLTSEPRFTNEVVVLLAQNVTLREAMDGLAEVCDASWQRKDDAFLLRREDSVQRALERRDRQLRVAVVQRALDTESKMLARWDTPEKRAAAVIEGAARARRQAEQGDWAALSQSSLYQPTHQFYLKILIGLGAELLATLPSGARLAFAYPANQAQRSMPGNYPNLLAEMMETGEAVRQLYDARGPSELDPQQVELTLQPFFRTFTPAKTILSVTNEPWATWAYMGMYDATGKMLTSTVGFRVPYQFSAAPFISPTELKPAQFSTAALEFQASIAVDPAYDDLVPMDKAMSEAGIRRLLNPELYDPLSMQISDGLESLAQQSGRRLVARIPDEIWRALPLTAKAIPIDIAAFLAGVSREGVVISDQDGWLVMRLSNPTHFERSRLSRQAFGKFLRASWEQGKMLFEEFCRLQLASDAQIDNTLIFRSYKTVMIGLGVQPAFGSGWMPPRMLAFLGTLSAEQWRILRAGEPLYPQRMGAMQRGAFMKIVPSASRRESLVPDDGPPMIMTHPTESIPQGPGPQTFVKFTPDEQGVVILGQGDGLESRYPFVAQNLASKMASIADAAGTTDISSVMPRQMLYGTKKGYRWEIQLIEGIVYGPADIYERSAFKPNRMSFGELPKAFRDDLQRLFEKELAEIKKGGDQGK